MFKFIKEWREFKAWKRNKARWNNLKKILLSMELKEYREIEILNAVYQRRYIDSDQVGCITKLLYCRCGRGETTLSEALNRLELNS